jgi:monovalent cation:proton antiporter-2 (CPA2) family protein
MHGEGFFFQAFVYLAAAVIAVPLAKRLGLGSVLGYLIAGVAIGPFALGLVGTEGQDVMHFAEFGVVMMLFVVGLELEPAVLWRLRGPILGLGGLQVGVTAVVLAGGALALGFRWQEAIAIGLVLAMSSTAIALQSLAEKSLLKTTAGQSAFAVLLFQDIAVIPMLAIFPLLAAHPASAAGESHGSTWIDGLPGWAQTAFVLGAVAAIVAGGRFVVGPAFRIVARARMREIFTAAALLLVIGIALLMTQVGLSPALGTFVAGVVLAGSEYRHELESDIEPFKGLLLGVFFIAVGASVDFRLVASEPARIAALVVAIMAAKIAVLLALAKVFRLAFDQALIFAVALGQVGEFAFVLLSFGAQHGVLESRTAGLLAAAVAITMGLTPLAILLNERLLLPRFGTRAKAAREPDVIHGENAVIVAGYGRFGQIVDRFLRAKGVGTTVLEHDSDQVDLLRRLGHRVFYGDATRYDLLFAAGAGKAQVLVLAIDDPEKRVEMAHTIKKHFPHLVILARSTARSDSYDLFRAGVEHVYRETFDTALRVGIDALHVLGHRAHAAVRASQIFRRHDERSLRELASLPRDDKDWMRTVRSRVEELERLIHSDLEDRPLGHDPGWDVDTLRDDVLRGTFTVPKPDAEP